MFPILLLLFICVPIIEIGLFIQVGDFLGLWPTIALVLVTAFMGASLVRRQGIQTLISVQNKMQQGEMPAQQIVEGVMLAIAGVLLLTPGFMTDTLSILVLLPAPRAKIAKELMKRIKINTIPTGGFHSQGGFGQGSFHSSQDDSHTFEGEYERTDEQNSGGSSNRLN